MLLTRVLISWGGFFCCSVGLDVIFRVFGVSCVLIDGILPSYVLECGSLGMEISILHLAWLCKGI